eukprot:IDg9188t1
MHPSSQDRHLGMLTTHYPPAQVPRDFSAIYRRLRWRVTAALRMMAYVAAADAFYEYCQTSTSYAMESMKEFTNEWSKI